MQDVRGKVAVIGVGYSKVSRNPQQSLGRDTVEACRNAIADAGLQVSDIDGVSTAPGQPHANAGTRDGVDLVTESFLIPSLGMPDVAWVNRDPLLVGSSFIDAVNAVAAGACRYALVWRSMSFPKGERYGQIDPGEAVGGAQFLYPYGHIGAGPPAHSLIYRRYMEKYGARREHMASFIVDNRRNALLNEKGYWYNERPEVLTKEDYLASRIVADPLCLYDCDVPIQGCAAWVLTSADRAKEAPNHPAYIAGYAQGVGGTAFQQIGGALEEYQAVGKSIGNRLWEGTGLAPKDIATANVYDGYSYFVYVYLEALGFCKEGEAFEFMQDGRTALGGQLPLNTSGGNLGEGRLHGSPQISEAVLQAMGRAGKRQVKDAFFTLFVIGMPWAGLGTAMVFSREPL